MPPQDTYVPMSDADLCTLIEKPPVSSDTSEASTVVVDLPSTRLFSGNFTAPTPGQAPSWMCAGCSTPAAPGLMVSATSVLSPLALSRAVPDWSPSRPAPRLMVMVAGGAAVTVSPLLLMTHQTLPMPCPKVSPALTSAFQ